MLEPQVGLDPQFEVKLFPTVGSSQWIMHLGRAANQHTLST